eukprot:s3851_g12.t1
MAFCPQLYFDSASRTWEDPLVFQELDTNADALQQWVFQQIPKGLKSRYPWGVDASGSLPVGFALLKRKKMFRKGRTIVPYLHAPLRKMLAGAAYAIQLMLRTSWQELDLSIPEIWRQIHQFLHEMPSSVRLCEFNDDLVGFFNSVPREMIVSALQMLIQDYQRDIGMSMFTIVDASGSLPVGFVLLKRKKMFRKGRTIVSYLHAPLRKMLAGAAYAIQLMLRTSWQGLDLSIPEIWRQLHQFLHETPSSVRLCEFNDDLVGFFNSVPREMIVSALQTLIQDYQRDIGVSMFTIDLRKTTASAQRALPHKPRGGRSRGCHTLEVQHLVSIVQLSFRTGVFVVNHRCFQQVRGTCIGNQISPVLSSLPVILRERVWKQSLQAQLMPQGLRMHHLFMCRYVGNRLVLCDSQVSGGNAMREFLHSGFYGSSIELEEVTDHSFFGAHTRTIQARHMVRGASACRPQWPAINNATRAAAPSGAANTNLEALRILGMLVAPALCPTLRWVE